jgi:hypothetical protein
MAHVPAAYEALDDPVTVVTPVVDATKMRWSSGMVLGAIVVVVGLAGVIGGTVGV